MPSMSISSPHPVQQSSPQLLENSSYTSTTNTTQKTLVVQYCLENEVQALSKRLTYRFAATQIADHHQGREKEGESSSLLLPFSSSLTPNEYKATIPLTNITLSSRPLRNNKCDGVWTCTGGNTVYSDCLVDSTAVLQCITK